MAGDQTSPEPAGRPASDLRLRVLSALVLGPAALAIAYLGGPIFAALVLAGGILFLREWLVIVGETPAGRAALAGYAVVAATAVLAYYGEAVAAVAVTLAAGLLLYGLSGVRPLGRWSAEGLLYAGLAVVALIVERQGVQGDFFVLYLIAVVWTTDIAAYFVGRSVGGPRLWPRVSPKKTWAGAIGGLVLGAGAGAGLALVFGRADILHWLALAVFLSAVSQGGDLLESAVKRRFGVKDSGALIPGHGGLMDRVDGLVAAAIAAAVLGLLLGGAPADPIAGIGLT
ncbi:phosphatidate cytidylyltransferase [Polymorphum gilvum]|uniref:Phosphatidate cytidylyltransferase n=1 Tax=Polymorphum gilvum (strain LMG 25793 / CGMCC 1.9160 / SL003B-26A1) TaxID=991905 RepID=F2IY20_POLGS|nr:phosphatidate cytidylyltransferase [Polymorphum gilvum]ADZ70523.1 Phosphatidate cytidylyltransferase [Polymorphum gilvum SL003B-26A1]